jgi:hypothetical protein
MILIAFAWLAWRRRRRDRPVVLRMLARAIFSRRVLLHRSTFADLAYCVISLATLGGIIGWAVGLDVMDQRRRGRVSNEIVRVRAATARGRFRARRGANACALSRL